MREHKVDLNAVASSFNKRAYKLSEVKDKIVRVAFDVCRFVDDSPEKLWQIQTGSDGDYIVAMYEDGEEKVAIATASPWEVSVRDDGLNIFYMKEHLGKVSAASIGFEHKDLLLARSYLPNALANNKTIRAGILSSLGEAQKQAILAKYPELS